MLIVVAAIGGKVNFATRWRRISKYRTEDVATNDIEVLQLRQKLVTGTDWQIPDMPEQPHGFQATLPLFFRK